MKSLFTEAAWKGLQLPEIPVGVPLPSQRLRDLQGYIMDEMSPRLGFRSLNCYRRVGHGTLDICFWIGDEDIIRDPEATSPKILWIYLEDEKPTRAFKMWDLPSGEQVEEEVGIGSDEDMLAALHWIVPPFIGGL